MDTASRTDSESDTVAQSGSDLSEKKRRSKPKRTPSKEKRKKYSDIITELKAALVKEKAGKRKIFQSLVKIAKEFEKVRNDTAPLQRQANYADQAWHEGGMWRAPQVLPGVENDHNKRARLREPISLSDLFFNIVVVTAFTRVGASTSEDSLPISSFVYFALIYFSIWFKWVEYSTRFDTTDLSAQASSLVICFVVLFASLSVSDPMASEGGTRIMMTAAFCSFLNMCLMGRVWYWFKGATEGRIDFHVKKYAIFNTLFNFVEVVVWTAGLSVVPETSSRRWIVFAIGIALSMRMPRAFMANDFHAACSKRGVVFLLLLGFMLQGIMVVASDFFQYESPSVEQYIFVGACCLLLFCIKVLYVDDGAVPANDHALLINRTASFCFHVGQFGLLLGMVVLGSGLNLLTHSYLAATAALPGHAKDLVVSGFGTVVFFVMFIKSMHRKRVPIDPHERRLFVAAHLIPVCTTLAIVGLMTAIYFDRAENLKQILWRSDYGLLWMLIGCAVLLVVLSWIDEVLELMLWKEKISESGNDQEYLTSPFGIWWCLHSEAEELNDELIDPSEGSENSDGFRQTTRRLSALSPLLGESVASLKVYETLAESDSGEGIV